ncbi:putative integral membrane protein [Clostridium sp. CAG:524]|jgi:hypothetical protein|nr:putative integral membrane protein [Clostridium sp. CAG:524]
MDKSLLKISGIIAIVFGILACLTLVGAIVGVPLIIGGAKMKEYADYTDEQIIANKDKILIWTIVFLFFCQISGILLLIFYIDSIGKYEKGITGDNMNYQSNMNTNNNAKYEELEKVKKLYDEKILTKEEYEKEKERILNQL